MHTCIEDNRDRQEDIETSVGSMSYKVHSDLS